MQSRNPFIRCIESVLTAQLWALTSNVDGQTYKLIFFLFKDFQIDIIVTNGIQDLCCACVYNNTNMNSRIDHPRVKKFFENIILLLQL